MERFAPGAARLAGIVCAITGWRPDDFWAATPEELRGLLAALNGEVQASGPPDATVITRLKEQFPDG